MEEIWKRNGKTFLNGGKDAWREGRRMTDRGNGISGKDGKR
jgi:hypothetical protein